MRTLLHLLMVFSFFCFFTACESENKSIRFGSGNKGGFYNKFAGAFAEQYNAQSNGAKIQVKTTAGSSANIRLMEEGFLDLAIVQGDILQDYLMKTRIRHPISAVAGLYTEAIQIVTSAESNIKTIADLKGKRVSVGEEESGVLRNAEIILNAYGISFDHIQKYNLGFKESANALRADNIDAFFCTAGIPTPSIGELAKNKNIRVISFDADGMEKIKSLHPELTSSDIPAGTYNGQEEVIKTLGVKAILVASLMAEDSTIQKVTEMIYIPPQNANEAAKVIPSMEFATTNIPVEFHPAAAAFYGRKNITVNAAAPLQAKAPTPSTGD